MSEEILKVLEKLKDKNNYQRDCNDGSCFIELFVNEIYILCKFMEDLQQKVEQLESIRKEAIELLKKCGIVDEKGNFNAYLDTIELKELLNILNKGDNNGK